jgi:hypothetical protein
MAGSDSRGMVVSNPGDLMYYGVDASVKYSFMKLIKSKVIDPSLQLVEVILSLEIVVTDAKPGCWTFWFTDNVGLSLATTKKLMTEKMLMAFLMLHPIFSILQVLLLNLEEKILTVMEYMIKMMSRRCWFKGIQRLS